MMLHFCDNHPREASNPHSTAPRQVVRPQFSGTLPWAPPPLYLATLAVRALVPPAKVQPLQRLSPKILSLGTELKVGLAVPPRPVTATSSCDPTSKSICLSFRFPTKPSPPQHIITKDSLGSQEVKVAALLHCGRLPGLQPEGRNSWFMPRTHLTA